MPHQCTTCERTFPDGSKEMLGGCPDCGGNKFQFLPSGAAGQADSQPAPAGQSASATGSSDEDIVEAPSEPVASASGRPDAEDAAQASARRSVVSREELPPIDDRAAVMEEVARDSEPVETGTGGARPAQGSEPAPIDRPDLAELRKELNDQFESIKILEPGQYELNLMELYDREEYIIALEEDGRYVIDVPTRWRDEEAD